MKNFICFVTISIIIFYSSLNAQWVQTNFPYGSTVNCLAVGLNGSGGKDLFVGTGGGGVFLSTNDGTSWQAINNGLTDKNVTSLSISDSNIFVGTNDGSVYHSTNSGASWGLVTVFPKEETARSLAVLDSEVFAGTYQWNGGPGGIYRSTNNGTSWNQVLVTIKYTFVTSLIIIDSNIFAGTSGLSTDVFRSSNNGTTWAVDDTTFRGGGGTRAFAVSGTNLFTGTNTGVYLSTNSGLSWSSVNNGLPDYVHNYGWITTLAVSPNGAGGNNLFAGTFDAGVFLSTNNGISWLAIGLTNAYVHTFAVTSTNLFAGTNNGVWRLPLLEMLPVELTSFTASANSKEVILNWVTATELNNRGFEIQRKVVEGDFATVGFIKGEGTTTHQKEYSYADKNLADGKYYYRLKQLDFSGEYEYSNRIEVDVRTLNNFTLEQNYPNPFNPATTIGYVLQERSNAKLTLLNAIGEEIAVLVNEEQDKGYHKVEFSAKGGYASGGDALNLSSGVYFYQLKAGSFGETRKMILLR